jgi:hypothetical protein
LPVSARPTLQRVATLATTLSRLVGQSDAVGKLLAQTWARRARPVRAGLQALGLQPPALRGVAARAAIACRYKPR